MQTLSARKQRRRVALIIETSNGYARGLLRGIQIYLRENRQWSIYLEEHSRGDTDLSWLAHWKGDGIIARIENETVAHYIRRAKVPTVDLSANRLMPELPYLETDDRMIASWAAEHLLERGFKHFAFCGDSTYVWSVLRGHHFREALLGKGLSLTHFDTQGAGGGPVSRARDRERMAEWLRGLPKPVGIMASYDGIGQQLLEACRTAQIIVPDEAAVIGVDNDELICELCDPPLSSIAPSAEHTGYEAAVLLERLMSGQPSVPEIRLVEPHSLVTRMSTDALVVQDSYVAEALKFIRLHSLEDIDVQDVLGFLPISRRSLESRFLKEIGRTPHEEIIRVKLKLIKELLVDTELTLPAIAERVGIKHAEYMNVLFKRETGESPGQFRKRYRG